MNRIKELRRVNGYSQAKLANLLGVRQATLSGWELGKWQPDFETVCNMADLFNVSADYLLGWEDTNTKTKSPLPAEFYEAAKDLSPDEIAEVIRFIEFIKFNRGK